MRAGARACACLPGFGKLLAPQAGDAHPDRTTTLHYPLSGLASRVPQWSGIAHIQIVSLTLFG